ncbi:DUF1906 domain-containing protein [Luteipulveratus sp. YIM 133132]|uniref:DUF1906 domain-containing protein n=1 Tax=Luteipulveratus flavus TaxID=3031728 RepID=UPI0023B11DDD|nr:glycoside hydrolase domain-containing protein [Luteipulveratus sp. YIM 133132]MDE9366220.1 DUF1906 domain-containing protein [Luteipulveratus sp. YIM 133132]
MTYRARSMMVAAGSALLLVLGLAPPPAVAAPATSVAYPASASATRFAGWALDTCTAPTTAQISAWRVSPYRAVGVYVGGANRTCAQPQLTASWVTAVARMGWRVIPVYMGLQAPCTYRPNAVKITPSSAASQGASQAADAVTRARALGMLPGSAIYGDMEHYNPADTACRTTVLTYLSAWTAELHRRGYVSGVYANLSSGAPALSQTYSSTAYARSDALWIARWDKSTALTGWAGVSDSAWTNGQRAKQYQGDHNETWGGVTLNIDSSRFDAPVATVAMPWTVTSSTALNGRTAPSSRAPIATSYAPRSTIWITCQTPGTTVGSTSVWDKLTNGTYVTDYYVSTASSTTYTSPLPRCAFPYQVTVAGLSRRAGPSTSYAVRGTLAAGALAWVSCQAPGSKVGTTAVWDRLTDGTWVTDYYVATPNSTTYTAAIPRC